MTGKIADQWILPFIILALIWMVLTKGDASSWIAGLPSIAIALAAYNSLGIKQNIRIRAVALPGFIIWFLWNSLKGGIDVTWRVLHPKLPIKPGFIRYELTLTKKGPRVFLINCLSLQPGSLSVDIQENTLILHALDVEANILKEANAAERQVARLFGIPLESAHG